MDINDIKESVQSFVESRLKSPYFASALLFWLYSNRILVFGVFNFEDTLTLSERVSWCSYQLHNTSYLIGSGISGSIISALVWAFPTMIVYNLLGAITKSLYILTNKWSIEIVRRVDKNKWVDATTHNTLKEKYDRLDEDFSQRKIEYSDAIEKNEEFRKRQREKDNELAQLTIDLESIKAQNTATQEEINRLNEEKNRFTISYAKYGKYDSFIEVTSKINDLIKNRGEFIVQNEMFGFDPLRNKIKELELEYKFRGVAQTLKLIEGVKVELKDNQLLASSTDESIRNEKWLKNQSKLAERMKGEWTLVYSKEGLKREEKIKIDEQGFYYIDGVKTFNLLVKEYNDGVIQIEKDYINGEYHTTETLNDMGNRLKGVDNEGFELSYVQL